jgi:hypothetical protein
MMQTRNLRTSRLILNSANQHRERGGPPEATAPHKEGVRSNMTDSAGWEWGEELSTIIVEPDPQLEQLRRLEEWLSHLTVWQQHLLTMPFAFVGAGISAWLNSVLPPVDPHLLLLGRPFGL